LPRGKGSGFCHINVKSWPFGLYFTPDVTEKAIRYDGRYERDMA
jgi:hypothetical protein